MVHWFDGTLLVFGGLQSFYIRASRPSKAVFLFDTGNQCNCVMFIHVDTQLWSSYTVPSAPFPAAFGEMVVIPTEDSSIPSIAFVGGIEFLHTYTNDVVLVPFNVSSMKMVAIWSWNIQSETMFRFECSMIKWQP